MPDVRIAARDPGAANVLATLARALWREGTLCWDIWALPHAAAIFREFGLPVREFSESYDTDLLRSAWDVDPARVLMTGTSHYAPFEPDLWRIARRNGAHSLAVLDNWANLERRFAVARPRTVAAIDQAQIDDLVGLGFARETLIKIGHPWLASLVNARSIAEGAPTPHYALSVLFVSEPIAGDVARGQNDEYGFDEFDSFAFVHRCACRAASDRLPVSLRVKFHPYDDAATFTERARALPCCQHVRVEFLNRAVDPHTAVRSADLVTGIASMLLLEALAFDRPVVSVQPGLVRDDTFIAGRRGICPTLTGAPHDEDWLTDVLLRPARRAELAHRQRGFVQELQIDGTAALFGWVRRLLCAGEVEG